MFSFEIRCKFIAAQKYCHINKLCFMWLSLLLRSVFSLCFCEICHNTCKFFFNCCFFLQGWRGMNLLPLFRTTFIWTLFKRNSRTLKRKMLCLDLRWNCSLCFAKYSCSSKCQNTGIEKLVLKAESLTKSIILHVTDLSVVVLSPFFIFLNERKTEMWKLHRITELFRLENTFKTIEANLWPIKTLSNRPETWVPCPVLSWISWDGDSSPISYLPFSEEILPKWSYMQNSVYAVWMCRSMGRFWSPGLHFWNRF